VEHEVDEIVKSWQEPVERHFLIRNGGNKLFQLCYNETKDQWLAVEVVEGDEGRKAPDVS